MEKNKTKASRSHIVTNANSSGPTAEIRDAPQGGGRPTLSVLQVFRVDEDHPICRQEGRQSAESGTQI